MTKQKERIVVVCPGRGTYNKPELGYLQQFHADKQALTDTIDDYRRARQQMPVRELDQQSRYQMNLHTAGENASALIYACAAGDFADINRDKYEIVAITGNSMGWYIALALSGALQPGPAIDVINTMGSMMTDGVIGGQLIYPVVDDEWQPDPARRAMVDDILAAVNLMPGAEVHMSIYLGGYYVIGGNETGLAELEQNLPKLQDTYPMRLFNHAAFHTPLLDDISVKARQQLTSKLFTAPDVPLIDGRGHIWHPYATNPQGLWDYTLGHQVVAPYDYSKAIEVAVKEFAPDRLVILGPGSTLGGATGQVLIQHHWLDMQSKNDFIGRQQQDPFILAMGMAEQRAKVVA